MSWAEALVPHLKAVHLSFIALWVAGLFALPRMLALTNGSLDRVKYGIIRRATHYGYIWAITPMAVVAIASGVVLIFLRDVFTVWIFAKLVLVAGLVAVHAWIGHTIVQIAEREGKQDPPGAVVPSLIICTLVLGILLLVLAKPELEELAMPAWLTVPLGRQLPFAVPNP